MKLILDFGNTLKKAAIFDKNKMVELFTFSDFDLNQLKSIVKSYPLITSSILSSVVDYPLAIDDFLSERFHFIKFNSNTPVPIINKYSTPETLGNDRICAVVAASSKFDNKNLLVIDVGSCITYDLITKDKEYLGGSISPGIRLRLKSLNAFTDKLPLLEPEQIKYLIGKTTSQSILSGVINGINFEIDGVISSYKGNYKDLKIIISGGDHNYFDKSLKNNIFALLNIVILGLNEILKFNEPEKK